MIIGLIYLAIGIYALLYTPWALKTGVARVFMETLTRSKNPHRFAFAIFCYVLLGFCMIAYAIFIFTHPLT
jgi:hypothetical protein